MKLILVRHGETIFNARGLTQGFSDAELTERGLQQAELLGQTLAGERIEAVYASDLRRAVATARAIARHHGVEVQIDPDLREMNQGVFEGQRVQDMRADYADFFREWGASPATATMPGGESLAELQERAWRAVQRIAERHPEGTVVAVGHNFCLHTILCRALGLHLNHFRSVRQDVAAINVVEFGQRGVTVCCMNDTSHLKPLSAPTHTPVVSTVVELPSTLNPPPSTLPTDTPVMKVIRERRSIRRMKSTPIPEEYLTSILEAARLAPSWGNRQCWRFVVVRDAGTRTALSEAIHTPKSLLLEAPVVVVACGYPDKSGQREGLDYFMMDMGIAVEHLVLQAHALGLSTCWIGLYDEGKIRQAIGVPEDMRVVALIPIGYPDQNPDPKRRRSLEEIVFAERF